MPSHHIRRFVLFAILCTFMVPSVASAATYRMVIQSHPDVGGKCIDVPNHQFVTGMRLQMWDCNNSVGQIFSYDETSQELTIGNLCVVSWGLGNPQDAVGLGSCNGGGKRPWKMMANGAYYQIVGVNGLCLDIRYGVQAKENGTPLDINTFASGSAVQQLWALVEAPQ